MILSISCPMWRLFSHSLIKGALAFHHFAFSRPPSWNKKDYYNMYILPLALASHTRHGLVSYWKETWFWRKMQIHHHVVCNLLVTIHENNCNSFSNYLEFIWVDIDYANEALYIDLRVWMFNIVCKCCVQLFENS